MPTAVSVQDIRLWSRHAGFTLPENALLPLSGYLDLLMRWNRVINLVGTQSAEATFATLIVDSLHLADFLRQNTVLNIPPECTCWDLGSGAGLPGIPLRMIWAQGTYWLVESREKRSLFLSIALARFPLAGTRVFCGRAEAFMAGPPPRTADLIISRAFMPWPALLQLVRSVLRPGGTIILLLREDIRHMPLWPQTARLWSLSASTAYAVASHTRYLCALSPT